MISDISFRLISSDFYFRKLTTDAFGSSSCTNTKRSSLYSGSKESEEGGRAERNHLAISTLSGKSFYEYECKGFERTIHLTEPSLVEKNMHIQYSMLCTRQINSSYDIFEEHPCHACARLWRGRWFTVISLYLGYSPAKVSTTHGMCELDILQHK